MDVSIVLGKLGKHNRIDGNNEDAKFTDDQPFGGSLQATPNLRRDHLRM
jgi:hypothetical protein